MSIDNGNDALMLGSFDSGMLSYLDPLAEASLDSFVDLSTFLEEGKTVEPVDGAAVDIDALMEKTKPVEVAVETAEPSMKGNFEEVEEVVDVVDKEEEVEEVVDVVDMEEEVVATTPDHDYVCKRPRLSTSSNASEEGGHTYAAASTSPVPLVRKYRERRDKNNVASRRSREIRKRKFVDMESKADELVVENEKLQLKIVELEKLAKEMKTILVSKLSGK
ncbi:thyrotroph embryonic factor-like [Haliotis cracherodii]|uniref:thyrotroph embryonic factor-like n=1 Tax=Haliotis cracherodii TaxID=6455 RepID=UPI0039ECC095